MKCCCSPPTLWLNGLSNIQFIMGSLGHISVWCPWSSIWFVLEFRIKQEAALKKAVMKKNLLSGQEFKQCTRLLIFPRRKYKDICIYFNSWILINGFPACFGAWKGHGWKIGDKDVWKRGMSVTLCKRSRSMSICVSCECSPKSNISRVEV